MYNNAIHATKAIIATMRFIRFNKLCQIESFIMTTKL